MEYLSVDNCKSTYKYGPASSDWWQDSLSEKDKQYEIIYKKAKERQNQIDREEKMKQILELISPYRKLKSDYFGMCEYYLEELSNKIYEIERSKLVLKKPSYEIETHIRELNSLPSK